MLAESLRHELGDLDKEDVQVYAETSPGVFQLVTRAEYTGLIMILRTTDAENGSQE
jgi:hypothetical protein